MSNTNKKANFLQNMAIKSKILSGFAAVLVVLMGVAGIGYYGFTVVNQEVDEMVMAAEESQMIAHIEAEFLTLRSHAREFANLAPDRSGRRSTWSGRSSLPRRWSGRQCLSSTPTSSCELR